MVMIQYITCMTQRYNSPAQNATIYTIEDEICNSKTVVIEYSGMKHSSNKIYICICRAHTNWLKSTII